ncbi:hypothetical protein N3K66_007837 [Trichothecium roseum]|uniref:Uncharacterized protein n=1 Tax=Trichothecium roseum TaxID=47278 RepID=A0ACC0URX1_9HYPO|nr:hypothetical protein N3K66_007837 [Trichothecium roseum]
MSSDKRSIRVYAKWRPLADYEGVLGGIVHETKAGSGSLSVVTINDHASGSRKRWSSSPVFTASLREWDDNAKVYEAAVAPSVSRVMGGGSCSFFAYGHSGSGKTHTMIGHDGELGLCLRAAHQLFTLLDDLNKKEVEGMLGIGLSVLEIRQKSVFDLLNGRAEYFVREDPNGRTHVQGEAETLPEDNVGTNPIVKRPFWDFESLRREVVTATRHRAAGSSSVHDQSSRTHAVLALEIINRNSLNARQATIDQQSEDVNVARGLSSTSTSFLGGRMVFVDLAGAEYHEVTPGSRLPTQRRTPQERQEGRQINADLVALKEVTTAWSEKRPRVPFGSSALTMVLREHFESAKGGDSCIIATLSSAKEQYSATLDSLQYASLVGAEGAQEER